MKKLLVIFLISILIFLSSCSATLNNEVTTIVDYYKKHEVSTFWDVTALCYAGEDMQSYNIEPFLSSVPNLETYSEVSGSVMALKMLEKSGYDISKYDLSGCAARLLEMTLSDDEKGYEIPINLRAFGIYALKIAGADYPDEKILLLGNNILESALPDGGFSVVSKKKSDIDTTALILPLLIYLKDNDGFDNKIDSSSLFIRTSRNKDDTYSSFGVENSNSTAFALSALTALGYTTKDNKIGSVSLALATFRLANGSYSFEKYGGTNMLSTAQALIAYQDLLNASNLWLSIMKGEY